jgi:hypothetical protein
VKRTTQRPVIVDPVTTGETEVAQPAAGQKGVGDCDRDASQLDGTGSGQGEVAAGVVGIAEPERQPGLTHRAHYRQLGEAGVSGRGRAGGVFYRPEALTQGKHARKHDIIDQRRRI